MEMSEVLESGHTVEEVPREELEPYIKQVKSFANGAVRLLPEGWFFSPTFIQYAKRIYNFKVKPKDIYVVTFPKSGTNWIQEIAWNLVHNPDLDNPDAKISIDARCPFYEIDFCFDLPGIPSIDPNGEIVKRFKELCPGKETSEGVFLNLAASAPEPRLIKNHLPCSLLPPDVFKISKVIYLARDIRDLLVSYYHFSRLHKMAEFCGTLEDFADTFIHNRIFYGPYWEHVRQAWEKRNDPNFLFIYFEDLKEDPKSEIRRIDKFLGTNRTDKQIENIVQYTSFANMKERTKDNPPTSFDNAFFNKEEQKKGGSFFRKGQVGSWREDFSPELEEKVNAWMKENLPKFGDEFKYKI